MARTLFISCIVTIRLMSPEPTLSRFEYFIKCSLVLVLPEPWLNLFGCGPWFGDHPSRILTCVLERGSADSQQKRGIVTLAGTCAAFDV